MNREIKKYQTGGGLLAGPIQSRDYVPLPYAQAFEMQRLTEMDRDAKEQGILGMYKGFYDSAMLAPPGLQDEAMAEYQPYIDRIEQGLAEVGGDPLKYRGGMDVMKSFYNDMATGRVGSLQRAGSQYSAAKKEYDTLNKLYMEGKGGVPEARTNLSLQIGLQEMQNAYDSGQPAMFSPPPLMPEVNVLEKTGEWLSQKEADGFTDSQGNKIEQITAETLLPMARNYMMMDPEVRSTITQEIDLNMRAGNFPMENVDMDKILSDKTYAQLYRNAITSMPLGVSAEDAQALASQSVYRAKLIDDRMKDFSATAIQPFLQTDITKKEIEINPNQQIPYTVSDSPMIPIDRSNAQSIGTKIMDLDRRIKNNQAIINAGGAPSETVSIGNQTLIAERDALLVQAGDKSEEMINDKAKKSRLWRDDVFNIKLESYFDNIKDASEINKRLLKDVSLEEFTEKAKILSAIPGIQSIPLLASSVDDIQKIQELTSDNYSILSQQFGQGESVMPYLQAAQWIQGKAKRADVINSYEASLRVPLGGKDSYIKGLSEKLTEMIHNGNLAYTDFYANEDVVAEVKSFDRPVESIRLQPTLSMINGAPAYKLDFFEYNKIKGSKEIEIGGLEKTEYVKGTNQGDELIRYEDLGFHFIKLAQSDPDTRAAGAYLRDGIQVIANARILSPLQNTRIETASVVKGQEDNDGNSYVEKDIPGFNFKVRRTDYPGNVSIFDLRNNQNKLIPYFPEGDDKDGQAIRSASLQEVAYQYFMLSKESIDTSGTLGRQVIQQYMQSR